MNGEMNEWDERAASEPEVMVISGSDVIVRAQESAALDVQVSTAKAYPRSVQRFQSDLKAWSRMTARVAESCSYALPRDGKKIVGPSIRFAELVASAWMNLVVDAKIVAEESGFIVCDAVARDMERNTASRAQVRRRIVDKYGKRYKESVIESTVAAGLAIARRNAIFAVVPRALWEPVWEEAKATAAGQLGDFTTATAKIVAKLAALGVAEDRWLAYVGREGPKDLVADDLLALTLAASQIERGESKADDLFPDPEAAKAAAQAGATAAGEAVARAAAAARAKRAEPVQAQPSPPAEATADPVAPAACGAIFPGPDGSYDCTRKPGHQGRHAWVHEPTERIIEALG